jgi:hypothetical protein
MRPIIAYKSGFKYQLDKNYEISPMALGRDPIETDFIHYNPRTHTLSIRAGYAWDGPSGTTIDTASFMRGSLVHDALYQLMREGHLGFDMRKYADDTLRDVCLEDGMWRIRAWWVHRAVRRFARRATLPSNKRPVKEAP